MSDDALREAAKVIVDAHGYGAKAGRPDYVACVSADKIEALCLALVGAAPGRAPAPERAALLSEVMRHWQASGYEEFDRWLWYELNVAQARANAIAPGLPPAPEPETVCYPEGQVSAAP